MSLKPPGRPFKKLGPDDLRHPKDQRSSWNGDRRRPKSEQGFAERRAEAGLTTDYAANGEQVRRSYINGVLVEGPAEEVVPVSRPILSQQPARIPVAGRDHGPDDVQSDLPPGVRPVERKDDA